MKGTSMNRTVIRSLSVATSVLLVLGGLIHLKIYDDGYRDVPNHNLGRSFLLNAAASFVCALALQAWRSWLVPLAGLVVVNGTLIGFALSRTDRGVFGFNERGFNPSPEAAWSLVVEIAAAGLLLVLLTIATRELPDRAGADRS